MHELPILSALCSSLFARLVLRGAETLKQSLFHRRVSIISLFFMRMTESSVTLFICFFFFAGWCDDISSVGHGRTHLFHLCTFIISHVFFFFLSLLDPPQRSKLQHTWVWMENIQLFNRTNTIWAIFNSKTTVSKIFKIQFGSFN